MYETRNDVPAEPERRSVTRIVECSSVTVIITPLAEVGCHANRDANANSAKKTISVVSSSVLYLGDGGVGKRDRGKVEVEREKRKHSRILTNPQRPDPPQPPTRAHGRRLLDALEPRFHIVTGVGRVYDGWLAISVHMSRSMRV